MQPLKYFEQCKHYTKPQSLGMTELKQETPEYPESIIAIGHSYFEKRENDQDSFTGKLLRHFPPKELQETSIWYNQLCRNIERAARWSFLPETIPNISGKSLEKAQTQKS